MNTRVAILLFAVVTNVIAAGAAAFAGSTVGVVVSSTAAILFLFSALFTRRALRA